MILKEHILPCDAQVVMEAAEEDNGSGKTLYMKGIFMQSGMRNLNGRIYPTNEIRSSVEEMMRNIKNGTTVWGECDHPEKLTINLDHVSHMITELWMDGPNAYGKLKVIDTPHGNIIKTMVKAGGNLGVSSRGSGDVDDDGRVSGFELVTVDIVATPSAKDAKPRPIWEALNNKRGHIIADLAVAVSHDKRAEKYIFEEVKGFINSLKL